MVTDVEVWTGVAGDCGVAAIAVAPPTDARPRNAEAAVERVSAIVTIF